MEERKGRFGVHGGQYIPETLMNAVIELEKAYDHYKDDPEFNRELTELFNDYAGSLCINGGRAPCLEKRSYQIFKKSKFLCG